MKKSTKAALAASAAGILLLGGAGSLAYWTADATVDGGNIQAGEISLSDPTCGDWAFDGLEADPDELYEAGDTVVPGDVISKVCTFDITAVGNHLRATLDVTDTNFTPANLLSADLDVDADFTIGANAIPAEITEANNGDTVTATIAVTFDPASDDSTQTLSTVLDDLTVTAEQVHH